MNAPLRVLIVEDSEDDAVLLLRQLRRSGYDLTFERVDTGAAMDAALDRQTWDIVIADYAMPSFSAPAALKLLQDRGLDLPFIIVSGAIGEDVAVAAMKAGAHDYIMKGNLTRLVPAIERELQEAMERRARQQAEEALRESEERYALAAQGANDGLWDWDLKANKMYFSLRWKSMLGYEEAEIGSSPHEWFSRVHPDDLEQVKMELSTHLKGVGSHFKNEHRMLHKDGTYRWMLTRGLAVRDADGVAYRMAGSQTDITTRKRAEEQLLHDAFYDTLTDLPNRALFMDRLGRAVERAKRRKDYLFAVLLLDLDRFKVVNDSLGHLMGDELVIAVARRLETCVRTIDTVARLGGDEFVILLEDIDDSSVAARVAERIQEELRSPSNLTGHVVFISASIGIVLSTMDFEQPEEIMRDADIAMYHAKALGGAQYKVFDTTMRARAVARLALESDLRQAVERQEFELHYQPIVSLETNRLTGFEALVRWQHPKRGLVLPEEFIPVAEETGLIIPFGRWVLREACRQMHAWQVQFPAALELAISVNLSSRQFAQPDLIEQVKQILEETGLDPRSLKLEITESAIIDNTRSAITILTQLRALGVQVQMDDFGTGYSSLSYLNQFPLDALKIDRSFTSKIGADGNNCGIIHTIVALARDLSMDVVAEGVETPEQLNRLRALQCNYGQGYLISRPLDSQSVGVLLAGTPAVESPQKGFRQTVSTGVNSLAGTPAVESPQKAVQADRFRLKGRIQNQLNSEPPTCFEHTPTKLKGHKIING